MVTLLIVDDSDDKVIQISKTINALNITASIIVASDIIGARSVLNNKKIDIVVLDQILPIRTGEQINENGGVHLIQEIQRAKFNHIPHSIFGLTVCEKVDHNFFWPFYVYNEELSWIKPFKSLVNYVSIYNQRYHQISNELKFEVYVEGISDFLVYSTALNIYFPELCNLIEFRHEQSAGADWVVRQLFGRVFLLPHKPNGDKLKCAAIFDNDEAGRKGYDRINATISSTSAERSHFKIFLFGKKYSPFHKKLNLDMENFTLEDAFPPTCWLGAKTQNLLETRPIPMSQILVHDSNSVLDAFATTSKKLTKEDAILFQTIYSDNFVPLRSKKQVAKSLIGMGIEELKLGMLPFKYILEEIIDYYFKTDKA